MQILAIGKTVEHSKLNITSLENTNLLSSIELEHYSYIIISGGDGLIRRVITKLKGIKRIPPLIINPTGSFNVISKLHRVKNIDAILSALVDKKRTKHNRTSYYLLNDEVFLFSAGNMGDMQHIFLSETLRFGMLKNGILKYIIAFIFLLPIHILITPFMLMSPRRFFFFTPLKFIKKIGTFRGKVVDATIDLGNNYNHIELDGDIVTIEEPILKIRSGGFIDIVVS